MHLNEMPVDMSQAKEHQTHSQCNSQEHEQCIQQACHPRNVILIRDIPDAIGKRHPRNQRNNRTYNHVRKGLPEAKTLESKAKPGRKSRTGNVHHNLRHPRLPDQEHHSPHQKAHHESSRAVQPAAPEKNAETRTAESRTQNLLPERLCWLAADLLHLEPRLPESVFVCGNIPGQLVDFSNLLHLGALQRDILHIGITLTSSGIAGGENTIAQHEEITLGRTVVGGNPFHSLLHAGNLSSVFQKYVTGLSGHFQGFRQIVLSFFHLG